MRRAAKAARAKAKAETKREAADGAKGGARDPGVEAYFASVPDAHRAALEKLRAQIHAAAPGATEKMAYGIPTFVLGGKNLVHMAAFKDHLSFFPGRAGVAELHAAQLQGYTTGKGTIQFTTEKPLPAALVKRIVRMRVLENAKGAKTNGKGAKGGSASRKGAKKKRTAKKRARMA